MIKIRTIGIDPGTASWSFYGLDDNGKVFLDTILPPKAEYLDSMIKLLVDHCPVDGIGAPSGYGLPVRTLDAIKEEEWFLLALKKNNDSFLLRKFLKRLLLEVNSPSMILPAVKHLRTVPLWKKVNRVDLGTTDKLCAALWTLNQIKEEQKGEWTDISFIHVELGYGFNAFISVEKGKVSGGIGGSIASSGFLSGGFLDSEVAVLYEDQITKKAVFSGGMKIDGAEKPSNLIELDTTRWEAYIRNIIVDIARIDPHGRIKNVYLSGRFSSDVMLVNSIKESLSELGKETNIIKLLGQSSAAARGSAICVNGLLGGKFASLIEHVELSSASGSVLDMIHYPLNTDY